MWLVKFSINRPHSILVLMIIICFTGLFTLRSMPVDILPIIDLPAIGEMWIYSGLTAGDMERRVVYISERQNTTQVDDVERIESRTIPGYAFLKTYFHSSVNFAQALAQMSAAASASLRFLPTGILPPLILPSNASDVPVVQINVFSKTVSEYKLRDYLLSTLRPKLLGLAGLSVSYPYGGRERNMNVDVDPLKLAASHLSISDLYTALEVSNLVLPSGKIRIGSLDYGVNLNSYPETLDEFKQIPIRTRDESQILLRDVASISEGPGVQEQTVRINGQRAVYVNVFKKTNASALDVVNSIKKVLPELQETAPKGVELALAFDQSTFVKSAIWNVLSEALIATLLVSLMIVLFLRSWRSAIIVCTSIPISTLFAIILLGITKNTINLMTLGGLSMAVGMLVDDATVEVENIFRNRSLGRPLTEAILSSAEQVALPAFISTLSICIVFAPIFFLTGPERFLFLPMALAVVFSMSASYFLSRTLVPLLSQLLLKNEAAQSTHGSQSGGLFVRIQRTYMVVLEGALKNPMVSIIGFAVFVAISSMLIAGIGSDLYPRIDAGLIKFHFRSPTGTRIEESEKVVELIEQRIQKIVAPEDFAAVTSMIGSPSSLNMLKFPSENVAGSDAEILVSLKKGHRPSQDYVDSIRKELTTEFPGSRVRFLPPDMVSQVLNFNSRYPIDVQITGGNFDKLVDYSRVLQDKLKKIPGLVDVGLVQVLDAPAMAIKVDRNRAHQFGVTQKDVANAVLFTLAGSGSVSNSNIVTPQGSIINISVQVPKEKMDSVASLLSIPVSPSQQGPGASRLPASQRVLNTPILANFADISQTSSVAMVTHLNVQRSLNVGAGVEGRDIGSAIKEVKASIESLGKLEPGFKISVLGQSQVIDESFARLGLGFLLAIGLVYLLLLALFQSFIDPLVVLTVVPALLTGVLWTLALTGTTLNIQSMVGVIMCVGIATANSILLVTTANDYRLKSNLSAFDAAVSSGRDRLRPVIMTALAMAIGIVPAALGIGEGGEQAAPLGRAVLGGLAGATLATLIIVPVVYSLIHKNSISSRIPEMGKVS